MGLGLTGSPAPAKLARVARLGPMRRAARERFASSVYRVLSSAQRRGIQLQPPVLRMNRRYDPATLAMIAKVAPYTQTSPARLAALREAVQHVIASGIPGAFVECGVWRGGSAIAVAQTLVELGATDRELWLYDTYAGMAAPTADDRTADGRAASDWVAQHPDRDSGQGVFAASLTEVRANIASTGYPDELLHFVVGRVEETLAEHRPKRVALLRLDTDFYESTRAELAHLYPLLGAGSVLIIDDYGYRLGARKAVDEYFARRPEFLVRVDGARRQEVHPRGIGQFSGRATVMRSDT